MYLLLCVAFTLGLVTIGGYLRYRFILKPQSVPRPRPLSEIIREQQETMVWPPEISRG